MSLLKVSLMQEDEIHYDIVFDTVTLDIVEYTPRVSFSPVWRLPLDANHRFPAGFFGVLLSQFTFEPGRVDINDILEYLGIGRHNYNTLELVRRCRGVMANTLSLWFWFHDTPKPSYRQVISETYALWGGYKEWQNSR